MDINVKTAKKKHKIHNPEQIVGYYDCFNEFRKDNNHKRSKGEDAFCIKYNLYNSIPISNIELHAILDKEYKKLGKYGKACKQILEEDRGFTEVAQDMGISRQRVWTYYNNVFLPRVRQQITIANNK